MAKSGKEMEGDQDRGARQTNGDQPNPQAVMDVWTADGKYSIRVGVAFHNPDGSFNVPLNALPVNRKLRLTQRTEKQTTEKA